MNGKFRKGGKSAEELLQAALELMTWQAELIRAALKKVAAPRTAEPGRQPEPGQEAGD
ncbi:MAG TPA: hypothetical protein VM389_07130 [Phycisphaerae bacterium]|nr:hypothetical protein [Phycisphaerae bacterium]HUU22294.1 hypothetical protein [Phycisphaerae bacterium]